MRTKTKPEEATGVARKHPEPAVRRVPLTPEILKRLYQSMVKCRMVDEGTRRFPRQKLTFGGNSGFGHEAMIAGATLDLLPEDIVTPARWYLSVGVVCGMPPKWLYAQLFASKRRNPHNDRSPAGYTNAPLNLISPALTMAAQMNIASGVALAYKLQKKDNLVVALSEASSSLAAWDEALHFASANKLPIVFVVNHLPVPNVAIAADASELAAPTDPGWARSEPPVFSYEIRPGIGSTAPYGFPCITVDGNDAVAVYRVCHEAGERARQGYGPTLVEATVCSCETSVTNPAVGSFPKKAEASTRCDPILALEQYLRRHGLFDEDWKRQITIEMAKEINEGIALAGKSTRRRKPAGAEQHQKKLRE